MTEVQALFLVLAAIYLVQCVVWLPQDCIAFRRNLRGRWLVAGESVALEALKLRGVLVNPFPPLPAVIACPRPAVFLSPDGIAAEAHGGALDAPRLVWLSFDHLRSIRANGKKLVLNDEPFTALMSPAESRHWAEKLATLKKSAPASRALLIGAELQARFNTDAIARRVANWREQTWLLRFCCNLLFAILFLVFPLVVWQRGLIDTWPYLLAALLCYVAVIIWEFTRAHRALHADAGSERFNDALSVALSPPAAVRANDLLMKELLRDFHPVAVAQVLLTAPEFVAFASQPFRELKFPKRRENQGQAEQVVAWWQTNELKALQLFLTITGTDAEPLLGPPPRQADCNSYCPRCWSQYIHLHGICKDCGDLDIVPFAKAAPLHTTAVG